MPEPTAGSRWNGDEWRWHRWNNPASGPRYISVIEPAEDKEPPPDARPVPFGFSRVLAPEPVEREPQLWEGED